MLRAERDAFALEFARIENHYFVNDVRAFSTHSDIVSHSRAQGFMRDGQLLEKQEIDKM